MDTRRSARCGAIGDHGHWAPTLLWHKSIGGLPIVGPLNLARDYTDHVEAAIDFAAHISKGELAGLLKNLNIARFIVIPNLGGVASLWVTARDLSGKHGGGCLGLEIKKNLLVRRNRMLKIAVDWAMAVPLFLLSLPAVAIAATWIKLSSLGRFFIGRCARGQVAPRSLFGNFERCTLMAIVS